MALEHPGATWRSAYAHRHHRRRDRVRRRPTPGGRRRRTLFERILAARARRRQADRASWTAVLRHPQPPLPYLRASDGPCRCGRWPEMEDLDPTTSSPSRGPRSATVWWPLKAGLACDAVGVGINLGTGGGGIAGRPPARHCGTPVGGRCQLMTVAGGTGLPVSLDEARQRVRAAWPARGEPHGLPAGEPHGLPAGEPLRGRSRAAALQFAA